MFANNYYTLVASFREFALDSEAKGFDIDAIKEQVSEVLSKSDMGVVNLLYSYYDCENLIALKSGQKIFNSLGNISAEELPTQLKEPTLLPKKVALVVRAYADPEGEEAENIDLNMPFATQIWNAYYQECAKSKSSFLRKWATTDSTIRNICAATLAKRAGRSAADVVIGENEYSIAIATSSSADFGLRTELDFVEPLLNAITDTNNLLEKEHKIDNMRWDIINELSTFNYFDLSAVLAYLLKMNMVARWTKLDATLGKQMLDKMLKQINYKI